MWRRRQQLAFRFAKFDEVKNVIYVEQPLTLTSFLKYLIGKGANSARKGWHRVLHDKSLIHRIDDKIYIVTPLTLLPWTNFRFLVALDHHFRLFIQAKLIRHLIAKLGLNNIVLWIGVPFIPLGLLHQFNQILTWYDYTEDFSAYSFMHASFREFAKHNDGHFFCHADIVSVVNQSVYLNKKRVRKEIYWIPNAVDIESFSRPLPSEPPEDLKRIKSPRLGFVGGINPMVNLELIEYVAQSCPQWSIVFIGNVDLPPTTLSKLQRYPSIYFLGIKPYYALPHFLHHIDVCIHSYRHDYDTNPQKIFLYMAAGKPVVELKPDGNKDEDNLLVRVATTKEEFIASVEDSLTNDSQELRQKRMEYTQSNSWDVRAQQIIDIIIRTLKDAE